MVRTKSETSKVLAGAAVFLGVGRPVRLEAEVATRGLQRFLKRYAEKAGYNPKCGAPPLMEIRGSKWGAELRIYFNAAARVAQALRGMGFHVEKGRPYNSYYEYRINSGRLWWDLVETGFRLGDNP
jgi:hypothetical protein